jgi:alpha-L-rhamnosidase
MLHLPAFILTGNSVFYRFSKFYMILSDYRKVFGLITCLFISSLSVAQQWIAPSNVSLKDYGVYHFRKMVTLAEKPSIFNIDISGDNRYILYVNGTNVMCGPQRSDVAHWRYETINLAQYLQKGQNVVAVTVWNQGNNAAWAQLSSQTGLWIKGAGRASVLNTDSSWRVTENNAYTPLTDVLHITGPFENIYAKRYPWNFAQLGYDDQHWRQAITTQDTGRTLLPRNIPLPVEKPQKFAAIRRADGAVVDEKFLSGNEPLVVAPDQTVTLLIDQGTLTTAYPEMSLNGGEGARISITYSEALYDKSTGEKGNRNEIEGKTIKGYKDVFIADGGDRLFRPLYYRTFRYVELKIENHQQPLTISSFNSRYTAYPFEENAHFSSNDTSLGRIWEIGWRTSRLCAFETYMDCPYYEQLQYVGDTRIQALISMYVSGDGRLMKNAIAQFAQSSIAEGLTQSRYPSNVKQIIPPFSLFWILMLHDYQMLADDEAFVKSMLNGVTDVLAWHEKHVNAAGMLGKMPYWNFVDWPAQWPWKGAEELSGIPAGALEGNSSILTLQYVYALQHAAEMFRSFGRTKEAANWELLAAKLRTATYKNCWDEGKGMIADSPEKQDFSQHANAMAVLADAVPKDKQAALLQQVEKDESIIQCTIYYRFYLMQAFKKAGLGDEYIRLLKPWHAMMDMGLTTFPERPEPTRSDCHAWSASPVYDLLATVCGIVPSKPGFKAVRITPRFGGLKWLDAEMPHPSGKIKLHLQQKENKLNGKIALPAGLTGELVWQGKTLRLKAGEQQVQF